MVGLADYAATKMVDKQTHFPGPGSYKPQLDTGRKVTILHRHNHNADGRTATSTEVGPGKYDVRGSMGGGPKISFSPRLDGSTPSSPISSSDSPRRPSSRDKRSERSQLVDIPKQYSMAASPASPRFSLYGRTGPSKPSSTTVPGPGQYTIGSTLSKQGMTLSARFDTENQHAAEVPGPGQYDVARFGDKLPLPKAPFIPHAAPREDDRPGPGWYEVHGTIEEKVTPRQRISTEPLFGARVHPPLGGSVAPGPGTYDAESGTIAEQVRHSKGKTIGVRNVPSGELESIYPKPGPWAYVIPTTIGDPKKGFTLHSRREDPPPKLNVPGPGQYHPGGGVVETILNAHQGIKFNGGRPFQKGTEPKPPRLEAAPGPGAYNPSTSLTSPRPKGFALNSRSEGKHDNPFVDWACAPGPGTYHPKEIHTREAAPGFTFHKGSFVDE